MLKKFRCRLSFLNIVNYVQCFNAKVWKYVEFFPISMTMNVSEYNSIDRDMENTLFLGKFARENNETHTGIFRLTKCKSSAFSE